MSKKSLETRSLEIAAYDRAGGGHQWDKSRIQQEASVRDALLSVLGNIIDTKAFHTFEIQNLNDRQLANSVNILAPAFYERVALADRINREHKDCAARVEDAASARDKAVRANNDLRQDVERLTEELRALRRSADPSRIDGRIAEAVKTATWDKDRMLAECRDTIARQQSEIDNLRATKKRLRAALGVASGSE